MMRQTAMAAALPRPTGAWSRAASGRPGAEGDGRPASGPSVCTAPHPGRTTVHVTLPPGLLIEAGVVAITAAKEHAE
ncbi:hypothetical protein QDR37_01495 [Amnibacterium sp. CER49]|uniref:hypothetical protein n=1 Tax=Amnibacterium sp. CER49 TaxID=3039161 RepID=UPI00244A4058|nr:hypothetical protein [Amnibacterium sp. CER49]MDH2442609.1 hypothetical protein [Amnibacterium sp. CER49]